MFLRGELDLATAPDLDTELLRMERLGPSQLVLDCRQLEFIDGSGIRVLVAARERAKRDKRALVLVNVPDQPRQVLQVTGLAGCFVFG